MSRVGGKAQLPAFRAVAGDLRLAYAQFEELETFARFGTRLDDETRQSLERGRRVREILKQAEHDLFSVAEQIAVLLAATSGLFDDSRRTGRRRRSRSPRVVREELPELCARIESGLRKLGEDDRGPLLSVARQVVERYRAEG